jgi:long-chain acyl-CoA synthetase
VVLVPLYDTLGPETLGFVVDQTLVATVVCTSDVVGPLCEAAASNKDSSLKTLVLIDGLTLVLTLS